MVWAEPVTGSSSMPDWGKKQRETKSDSSPGAVTTTPLAGTVARSLKSGWSAVTDRGIVKDDHIVKWAFEQGVRRDAQGVENGGQRSRVHGLGGARREI